MILSAFLSISVESSFKVNEISCHCPSVSSLVYFWHENTVKRAKNAMGINEDLAHYRIRKSGISRKKIKKLKPYFELMHKYLHYPFILSCWFLFTNIFIGKLYKYEKEIIKNKE